MKKVKARYVWSDEDIEFLKSNYGAMGLEDLGRYYGVSHTTVRLMCKKLGLSKSVKNILCIWTDDKVSYLKEHFPYETLSDVSDALGFSPYTVRKKVAELGLEKDASYDKRKFYNRYVKNYKHQ